MEPNLQSETPHHVSLDSILVIPGAQVNLFFKVEFGPPLGQARGFGLPLTTDLGRSVLCSYEFL